MTTRESVWSFVLALGNAICMALLIWGVWVYMPREKERTLNEVRELLIKRDEAIDKIDSKLPFFEENGKVELHFANMRLNEIFSETGHGSVLFLGENIVPDSEGYPGACIPEKDW